jgi:transposase
MKTINDRLLTDEQWSLIQLHLLQQPAGGRKRVNDRKTPETSLFMLRSGIPWNLLSPAPGDDSTAHLHLKAWQDHSRRLTVRWERDHRVFEGFLMLRSAMMCLKHIPR